MSPRSPHLPLKPTKHIKPVMVAADGGCGSGDDDIIGKGCGSGECGSRGAVIDEEMKQSAFSSRVISIRISCNPGTNRVEILYTENEHNTILARYPGLSSHTLPNFYQTYKEFSVIIMAGSSVKEMTTNFRKLEKFEGHDFRRWQKKMHFLLTTLKAVYVLATPMPELLEDDTVESIRRRAKWENDGTIQRTPYNNDLSLVQLGSHLRIEESLRAQKNNKGKGKNLAGPSVNMAEG
ncbi:hypothetical protein Tco_0682311, partial [Tanacetum coccineum]